MPRPTYAATYVQRCPLLPALIHTRSDRGTPLPTHALLGAHVTIQYRHVLHSASLARAPHGPIQATPHERCASRTPHATQGMTHAHSNPCIPWPTHAPPPAHISCPRTPCPAHMLPFSIGTCLTPPCWLVLLTDPYMPHPMNAVTPARRNPRKA